MKPTIILLAPEPLAAAWREILTSDAFGTPLLDPREVAVANTSADVPEFVEGEGECQILFAVLAPTVPLNVFIERWNFPKLTFAVAENPRSPWGDFGDDWPEKLAELRPLISFPVVADPGARVGFSVYAAAARFLEGRSVPTEAALAEWRALGPSGRRCRYAKVRD